MTDVTRGPRLRLDPLDVGAVLALVAAAVGLRLVGLRSAYDVFVDEITYLRISQGVLRDGAVTLYGEPFYLHPPGFFYLQAGWLALTRPEGGVVDLVLQVRLMQVVLAALGLVLLYALVRTVAGRAPAVVAGVFFAVDPFIMRIQSRNLLETAAMTGALAGVLLLARGVRRDGGVSVRRAVAVGVCFGLSVVTKETTAFVTVLPLALLVAGRVLDLRAGAAALVAVVLTYAPYPLVVALSGQGGLWLDDKTLGVRRLAGQVQLTGFNRPGSASFVDRVVEQLDVFAPTYGFLALGACYCLVLWRLGGVLRVVGAWAVSAYALAGYTVLRGTLEEQLFYLLVLPSVVVVCSALPVLRRQLDGRAVAVATGSLGIAAAAALVVSAASYVETRREGDDAYVQLLEHLERTATPGASIAVGTTSETAQFVLDDYSARTVDSLEGVARERVEFVLVSSKAVEDGTVVGDAELLAYLEQEARVAFRTTGPSVGVLTLYEVDSDALERQVRGAVDGS